jgi:iron complex transport system permease protein
VVAFAVVAVALAEWLRGLVLPPVSLSTGLQGTVAGWAWWVAPVVVGLGIAATGLRSAGRVVGAVLALVVLLVGPALLTAVDGASGMRVLMVYPFELVSFGSGLFGGALGRGLVAVVVAAVIAGVGAAVVRRRHP